MLLVCWIQVLLHSSLQVCPGGPASDLALHQASRSRGFLEALALYHHTNFLEEEDKGDWLESSQVLSGVANWRSCIGFRNIYVSIYLASVPSLHQPYMEI